MKDVRDEVLADDIIARLNKLCEDEKVRDVIARLLEIRVPAPEEILNHPTLQFGDMAHPNQMGLGFIGLLNGFVGALQSGEKEGWGYI